MQSALQAYVANVVHTGRLHEELERVQWMMIRLTKVPIPDKAAHRDRVTEVERIFRALLQARDAERLSQASELGIH
jgi:hypothetical protein